jgi:hypothetical protein
MKALAVATFFPTFLFGQFVNMGVDHYSFVYPANVKSVIKTTIDYDIEGEDTIYQHTRITKFTLDEKGEYTYYQTTENGDLLYEMNQSTRDNGRTVIRRYRGLNLSTDSVVTKLDDRGNPMSIFTYRNDGPLSVNNFQYDKNGNKTVSDVNLRDSIITMKYTYDKANRVLSETELRKPMKGGKELKFNERSYVYNSAGQKTSETHKYYSAAKTVVADTVLYFYNEQNQMSSRVYKNGRFTTTNKYTYDKSGNLVQDDFTTTEQLDYDATMTEVWTFDAHGYWASYLQKVDYQEAGADYSTVYNSKSLPESCTILELGTLSKITWEYEYR